MRTNIDNNGIGSATNNKKYWGKAIIIRGKKQYHPYTKIGFIPPYLQKNN